MRKRKQTYPPARTSTGQRSTNRAMPMERPTVVSIDVHALAGAGGFAVGDRVRINGTGLYAGETAVVEALTGTAIPSVFVRTDAGGTRRVRTIDVERLPAEEGRGLPAEDRQGLPADDRQGLGAEGRRAQ